MNYVNHALSVLASYTGTELSKALESYQKSKQKLKDELEFTKQRQANGQYIDAYKKCMSEGLFTEALHALYPASDLKDVGLRRFTVHCDDKSILTTIVGMEEELRVSVDLKKKASYKRVGPPEINVELDLTTSTDTLVRFEALGIEFWEQPIYRLANLFLTKDELRAEFSVDSFLRYLFGLGAMENELISYLTAHATDKNTLAEGFESYLPLRHELLQDADAIANYRNRMCAGGIHTTVAIQRPDPDDDFVIPLQLRSPKVSGGQWLITVAPEAYHQPMVDPDKEISLAETFYREFYEELLGGEEATRKSQRLCHDWYKKDSPALEWLLQNSHSHRLICTGIGFNLMSGNYEVGLLCLIKDTNFWEKHRHRLRTNWEGSPILPPFISTKDPGSIKELLRRQNWTASGLYSLSRALEYLKAEELTKVSLPRFGTCVE